MGLLAGKRILVTGVTDKSSLAYRTAALAQREGAEVVISNFGRAMRLTRRAVAALDPTPVVLEMDATDSTAIASMREQVEQAVGTLDGIVHSIAYADPMKAMGGQFLSTRWEDVGLSLRVSAYSLVELVKALGPLLQPGASIVGLTFDSTVSWPSYDWMGVSKATLDSVIRYSALYLGPSRIRANVVSAGPVNTLSKKAIPRLVDTDRLWSEHSPLDWDVNDGTPVAQAVVLLLSDWLSMTTGEVLHVDGGFHIMGL
ncbi:MAG: enoyl-ACP reductase FabI [Propionibacteriaceae bacterium]|jgi:enoyl-[acyl-carrier protein] reductase I|nr:enoyl-ACP reductase FabI [Propionibacteriaceae bacterium]